MTSTTTTHVLRLTWSTSRGRDTYGWNVVSLLDETAGKRFRTIGGGYDMVGTVFADWLEANAQNALRGITVRAYASFTTGHRVTNEHGLYGMTVREDGHVHLDGGCGLESILRIADAIGVEVTRTRNRKGDTTGWLVTL